MKKSTPKNNPSLRLGLRFCQGLMCVFVGAMMAGCASVENITRAYPSHFAKIDASKEKADADKEKVDASKAKVDADKEKANSIIDLIKLQEFDSKGRPIGAPRSRVQCAKYILLFDWLTEPKSSPPCYISADVGPLLLNPELRFREEKGPINPDVQRRRRNEIAEFLMHLSDRNAQMFMGRIFASNKLRHGTLGVTRDLAAVGAAGTAMFYPPVAVGLAAANLYGGTLSDQIDKTFYGGESVEILLLGMEAARSAKKKEIRDKMKPKKSGDNESGYADYGIYALLSDIMEYDSCTSFRKGLQHLQKEALK